MTWHYYACNRCGATLRTSIDNPNAHYVCGPCGYTIFNEITKKDYDKERRRAPSPK